MAVANTVNKISTSRLYLVQYSVEVSILPLLTAYKSQQSSREIQLVTTDI